MDIALAPITITAERELLIDFTKPFMDFSMSLIMQKAGDPPMNIFAFLQPFTGAVWVSTIGVVSYSEQNCVSCKRPSLRSCLSTARVAVVTFQSVPISLKENIRPEKLVLCRC